MRIVDHILGGRLDADLAHRLHHLEHRGAVDVLAVPNADIARRRLRATTSGGRDVAVALPRDQTLFDGAVLALEADYALVVRVGAERWLRLTPRAPADALELGYHAGNLHWRVRFDGDALLVAIEGPPDAYLARLGALVADGRVAHAVQEPDQEPGRQPVGTPAC